MLKFLEELINIDSPSGFTQNASQFLKNKFEDLGHEVGITPKGSVYVYIDAGKESTLCLSAHADTLGLVVRSINSDGTLRVTNVGGPILSTINGEYCTVYTRDNKKIRGTILNKNRAAHVHKESSKKVEIDDLIVRLDHKVNSKDDVIELGISNGDFICYDPKFELQNDFIKSRFLDDKAGVAIVYEVAKKLDKSKLNQNLLLFFSVYEEVGHGSASLPMKVDSMIAIDMGCVGEDLDGNEFSVSICSKDSSGPYDYELTTTLINLAKSNNLSYAVDIYPYYGSDASAALRAGNEMNAALIGPGVDASHGMERTHLSALENTVELLVKYLQ